MQHGVGVSETVIARPRGKPKQKRPHPKRPQKMKSKKKKEKKGGHWMFHEDRSMSSVLVGGSAVGIGTRSTRKAAVNCSSSVRESL